MYRYSYSLALQLLPTKPVAGNALYNGNASFSNNLLTTTTKPKASRSHHPNPILSMKANDPIDDPDPDPDPCVVESNFEQLIQRQSNKVGSIPTINNTHFDPTLVGQAYETCRKICAHHSTSYYLGSLLFTEERRKAIWAVYAWGHRTDELVDGANANLGTPVAVALDKWEERLEDIFDGRPHDMLDTALADTVQRYSLDIELFKYMIKGMRMDTWKTRYDNYEELKLYSCYVAGTVALIIIPIAGISPEFVSSSSIYKAAIYLALADQLTNVLRDVVQDYSKGRVYLPQDELREFGLTDEDISSRNVTQEWRELIKKQVKRARYFYNQGQQGASQVDTASRWPIHASIMLYQKILDKIEENNYDNLTKLARVGNAEKLLVLPIAYAKAKGW